MSIAITRRADRYAEMLQKQRELGSLRDDEEDLLVTFEQFTADVLDRYEPPAPRNRDNLVFERLYLAAAKAGPGEQENVVLAALLAAETEARGPLRLTSAQTSRLAGVLERLGARLGRDRLPLHAARAFSRAGALYVEVEEQVARDRCLLAGLRARHRARRWGLTKILESISDALCGYGYQPYRLLGWGVVQLAAFSVLFISVYGAPVGDGIYLSLANYLNPLGIGESGLPGSARIPLVVESYAGLISYSVFFALVVRRWFRL
jgi:hypothetical protein